MYPPKAKAISIMLLFLLSTIAPLMMSDEPDHRLENDVQSLPSNHQSGLHTSSAILINDYHVENLTIDDTPYRWYKTSSQTNMTYVNITSSLQGMNWESWHFVELIAYTAYDTCISLRTISLSAVTSNSCINPTDDTTVYIRLDFSFNREFVKTKLQHNITVNVSIGHGAPPVSPPANMYSHPDGDLNSDSSLSNPVISDVGTGFTTSVSGHFEGIFDEDSIRFSSQFIGTHRLHLNSEERVDFQVQNGLSECDLDYGNGLQNIQKHLRLSQEIQSFKNGFLLVANHDSQTGYAVWFVDKLGDEPTLLMNSMNEYYSPSNLYVHGETAFFSAYSNQNFGNELWRTDGTPQGTFMVKDIQPGSQSSNPVSFLSSNGRVFFSAYTSQFGYELWATDGTTNGTNLVENIANMAQDSYAYPVATHDEQLYFLALLSNRWQLWKTNGTLDGTLAVKSSSSWSSPPSQFFVFNERLFFMAVEAGLGKELWVSDGTTTGTQFLKDITPGSSSSNLASFAIKDRVYMITSGSGVDLWATNGTIDGTVKLQLFNYPLNANTQFTKIGNEHYLTAVNNNNGTAELYRVPTTQTEEFDRLATVPGDPSTKELIGTPEHLFLRSYDTTTQRFRTYTIQSGESTPLEVDFYPYNGRQLRPSLEIDGALYEHYSQDGIGVFQPSEFSTENQTKISCLVTSPTPQIRLKTNPEANLQNSNQITPWRLISQLTQVHAAEDSRTGDSQSPTWATPVGAEVEGRLGSFHHSSDRDYFTIPIQHGSFQSVEIQSNGEVDVTLDDQTHCEVVPLDGPSPGSSFAYLQTITCDTRNMSDEIRFNLLPLNDSAANPRPHYSISTSTTLYPSFRDFISENNIQDDVPSVSTTSILERGVIQTGSFLFASDTVDSYRFEHSPTDKSRFELRSNCATILSQKSSYLDQFLFAGHSTAQSTIRIDPSIPNQPFYTIEVKRLYQSSETSPKAKSECEYELLHSEAEPQTYSNAYLPSSLRLTEAAPILFANFTSPMEGVSASQIQSYYLVIPLDFLPTKHGKVMATQGSGVPIDIHLNPSSSTQNRYLSAIGELYFGQNIDIGSQTVQWRTVRLSGLDGSPVTIQVVEAEPPLSTSKESSDLFSMASGNLGVSQDEGFDIVDHYTLNNSDMATYFSVQLTSLTGTLDASLSPWESKQSMLMCLTGNQIGQVSVHHRGGSGGYSLEVKKGYGSVCPLNGVSVTMPSRLAIGAEFRVKYESAVAYDVSFELVDERLTTVKTWPDFVANNWNPVRDLFTIEAGTYTVLVRNHDQVIIHEQTLEILSTPDLSAWPTDQLLDVNEQPKLHINAAQPHTLEPAEWSLSNVYFSGINAEGNSFIEANGNVVNGIGKQVVEFSNIPQLMSGSQLIINGTLTSEDSITNSSWIWNVGYISPKTECQPEIQISPSSPENQILCLITFDLSRHGFFSGEVSEEEFTGRLEVYNSASIKIDSIPFTSNRFTSTPIRIDYDAIRSTGDFQTVLVMDEQPGDFFTESVGSFSISGYALENESDEGVVSEFEFNFLSIRDTATAGDEVTLLWEADGQPLNFMLIDVYVNGETLAYSQSIQNEGQTYGEISLKLPESINPYNDHLISITAVSQFGETQIRDTMLQGLPATNQIFVNMYPKQPTIGEDFEVTITHPRGDNWLSWEWTLYNGGSTIDSGVGFVEANSATITVFLPTAQYSQNPTFTISVETKNGEMFYNSYSITPLPMRSVQFEFTQSLVADESADFEWELKGIYLNQMDNIQNVKILLYSLNFDLVHEEQFFGNATKGKGSIQLPASLNPGTYNVVVIFQFADGTSYRHDQTAQVYGEPLGINLLGLTIPPLMMGLDTLLVLALIVHATILHRRLKAATTSVDPRLPDEEEEEQYDDDHYEYDEETPQGMVDLESFSHQEQDAAQDDSTLTDEPDGLNRQDAMATDPNLYQEYPVGSGNYWYRDNPDDEWQMVA